MLDSRPKGRGFEPHRRHCVVSLSKNINPSLVLVQPRKTRPYMTERLLMGRKESKQTNKQTKFIYSKTYVKRPLSKRPKIGFEDQLSLNAGQKYCRMLQGEHSAILKTFIKLPFVIKIFVLSIYERPFYTGFTVLAYLMYGCIDET